VPTGGKRTCRRSGCLCATEHFVPREYSLLGAFCARSRPPLRKTAPKLGSEPTGKYNRDTVGLLRSRLPWCCRSNRGFGDAGHPKGCLPDHHGRTRTCPAHHAIERLCRHAFEIPRPQWRLHHEHWVWGQGFASFRKRCHAACTFSRACLTTSFRTLFRRGASARSRDQPPLNAGTWISRFASNGEVDAPLRLQMAARGCDV
jgi:hypothetical protein